MFPQILKEADSIRRGGSRSTWRRCRGWCEAPLTVLMRGLPTSSAQWLWSQFTLADHAFVWLSKALYLILKFAVVHRQSFDDDIRSLPHIQACRKQTRANLEFVHDAHHAVTLRSRLEQVHAKGTQILGVEFASATFACEEFPNTQIISKARFGVEEFHTKLAQGYCERASD